MARPRPIAPAVRAAIRERIAVDPRALAALRIAIGALVCLDLAWRSIDLVAFYTDAGVLPRPILLEQYPAIGRLSLHALSGGVALQVALFGAAAIAGIALVLGIRTRTATAVTLLLLVSLHARNPVVLNAGDSLLRRLALWGLLLPLGAHWSVDAIRSGGRRDRVAGVATAGLLVQVVLVYVVNAAVKLRGDVWLRGDALAYVFSLDRLTVGLGNVLAGQPAALQALNWAWLGLVVASPLLILLTGRARTALALAFMGAHLGMAATLRLGPFPLISIASLLPFLSPAVWDWLERRVAGAADSIAAGVGRFVDGHRWLPGAGDRRPLRPMGARVAPAIAAILLATVLVWNAAALGLVDASGTESVSPEQFRWDMFAPHPPTADGWYVAPGRTAAGRTVDALGGGPVSMDRPPDVAAAYPSHRWMVYLVDLRRPSGAPLRPALASHLCQRWIDRGGDPLESVSLVYREQPTRLAGPEPIRSVQLGTFDCAPA